MIGVIGVVALLALLAIGVPIGVAVGVVGMVGLFALLGFEPRDDFSEESPGDEPVFQLPALNVERS